MKVLHLISSGGFYGAEAMLLNLLEAQLLDGVDASLLALENRRNPHVEIVERARRKGLPAETVSCRGRFDRDVIAAVAELVERRRIGTLHSHGYKSNFYASAASRRAGIPFVATCHLWTRATPAVRLYELLDAFILRRAAHVAGVSEEIVDALRASGLSSSKTSVIHNGIGALPMGDRRSSLRAELGIGDAPLIGAIARLETQKGLFYFIEAAERVAAQFPRAVFAIAGDGSLRRQLAESIDRRGLSGRVLLLGQRNDVQNIYAALDVFVLPSLNEGLPMVLLEAMSASLPVVATGIGAVPQVVRSGHSGLLIEPADVTQLTAAILSFLRDPGYARILGSNGQATVCDGFSARSMARRYLSVYAKLPNMRTADRLGSLTEA